MKREISAQESQYAEFATTTIIYAVLLFLIWGSAGESWSAFEHGDTFTTILAGVVAYVLIEIFVRFRKREQHGG